MLSSSSYFFFLSLLALSSPWVSFCLDKKVESTLDLFSGTDKLSDPDFIQKKAPTTAPTKTTAETTIAEMTHLVVEGSF